MPDNRAYYDAFSRSYDERRNRGYHKLIDDQAAAIVRRVGVGKEVLEVGCGTGLILQRVAAFASRARGIDLSPGMLARARERGLDVDEGSASDLPFEDDTFDVAYSFKVLAHVPNIERALGEMVRVVRPGGHVVFDAYNRHSMRWILKRLGGPRGTSQQFDESAISTKFMSAMEVERILPVGTRVVHRHGIRVVTPHARVLELAAIGPVLERLEWHLMTSKLARFAGFLVFTLEKEP